MPNKFLDLVKEEDYKILGVLPERQSILHYVNLHDEIPEGIRDKRQSNTQDEDKEYNIREMWKRLEEEEPSAVAEAQIFNHLPPPPKEPFFATQPPASPAQGPSLSVAASNGAGSPPAAPKQEPTPQVVIADQ